MSALLDGNVARVAPRDSAAIPSGAACHHGEGRAMAQVSQGLQGN
ncbi:hypothetical protein [Roseicitreum antarcticum]|nr:hypothetical protein [Roseicitreum antarcticum]